MSGAETTRRRRLGSVILGFTLLALSPPLLTPDEVKCRLMAAVEQE